MLFKYLTMKRFKYFEKLKILSKALILSFRSLYNCKEQWLLRIGLINIQFKRKNFSFDLISNVSFRSENAVSVVHVVKLEKFFNQIQKLFSIFFFEYFWAFYVFPVEWRYLS